MNVPSEEMTTLGLTVHLVDLGPMHWVNKALRLWNSSVESEEE